MYIGPDETKLGQEDFFKIDGKTAKSHEKHAVFSALDQLLTQELFWKDIQKDQGLHKASKYEGVFGCLCLKGGNFSEDWKQENSGICCSTNYTNSLKLV